MSDNLSLPEERGLPGSRLTERKEHLLSEISRRQEHRPLVRRPLVRGAALAVGLAVVALVVLSVVNVFGPGGPTLVEKAAAALALPDANQILHLKIRISVVDSNGTSTSYEEEGWQLLSTPYPSRTIGEVPGKSGSRVEMATAGPSLELYDPAKNTIYSGGLQSPSPNQEQQPTSNGSAQTGANGTAQGTAAFLLPMGYKTALQQIVDALLGPGKSGVEQEVTVNGRAVVRFTGKDPGGANLLYLADASTYNPIEFQSVETVKPGLNASTTIDFLTYEKLPATAANLALLSLAGQHPGATVDNDPQHFAEALTTLVGSAPAPSAHIRTSKSRTP